MRAGLRLDRRLYIGHGSASDRGETGTLPCAASILVAERDGTGLRVITSSAGNAYDPAYCQATNTLFPTDKGRDVPAYGVPDELDQIVGGGNYGWPDCWGTNVCSNSASTLPPVVELPAHAAAAVLALYADDLFPEWKNIAFVAFRATDSGDLSIGHKLERVELSQAGAAWHGTLNEFRSAFNRPLDVTDGPEGHCTWLTLAPGSLAGSVSEARYPTVPSIPVGCRNTPRLLE